MKIAIKSLIVACVLFIIQNCAPSRFVKPLQKKEHAASFTFGGPLITFAAAPIPIPFTTLGYGYGLNDNITLYSNLHSTSLLFGNLQTDIGSTINIYKKEYKFGITTSPALQIAYNFRNNTGFRVWPSLDINTYFHFNEKPSYAYTGINSWFELSSKKAHNETQNQHIIPNIHLGYMLVKTKWQHQFQFSYLALGISNTPGVVDYIGISGKGSFGFYYSLIRKF